MRKPHERWGHWNQIQSSLLAPTLAAGLIWDRLVLTSFYKPHPDPRMDSKWAQSVTLWNLWSIITQAEITNRVLIFNSDWYQNISLPGVLPWRKHLEYAYAGCGAGGSPGMQNQQPRILRAEGLWTQNPFQGNIKAGGVCGETKKARVWGQESQVQMPFPVCMPSTQSLLGSALENKTPMPVQHFSLGWSWANGHESALEAGNCHTSISS